MRRQHFPKQNEQKKKQSNDTHRNCGYYLWYHQFYGTVNNRFVHVATTYFSDLTRMTQMGHKSRHQAFVRREKNRHSNYCDDNRFTISFKAIWSHLYICRSHKVFFFTIHLKCFVQLVVVEAQYLLSYLNLKVPSINTIFNKFFEKKETFSSNWANSDDNDHFSDIRKWFDASHNFDSSISVKFTWNSNILSEKLLILLCILRSLFILVSFCNCGLHSQNWKSS